MPMGSWSQNLGSLACQSRSAILSTLIGTAWNVTWAVAAPQGVDDIHLQAVTYSTRNAVALLVPWKPPPEPHLSNHLEWVFGLYGALIFLYRIFIEMRHLFLWEGEKREGALLQFFKL